MQQTIVDPVDGIYATTDDYVHALEVCGTNRQLYVSGTMGIDEKGEVPKELDQQLDLIWSNIRRTLRARPKIIVSDFNRI